MQARRRVLPARIFAPVLVAAFFVAAPVHANQYVCFGDGDDWCAWTVPESKPEMGWGVINRATIPGLVLETVVDSRNGIAVLRIRLSHISDNEKASALISIRGSSADQATWHDFNSLIERAAEGTTHFVLERMALEALLEAPKSGHLYIFVEVNGTTTTHKASHKIALDRLQQALRFARLGR